MTVNRVYSPTLLPTSTLYLGCPQGVHPTLLPTSTLHLVTVNRVYSPTLLPTSTLYLGCPRGVQPHTVANFYLVSWLSKGCAAPHCCQLLPCILAVHRVCIPHCCKLLPCILAVHKVCSPTLLPTSTLYIGCPQGVQLHTVANFYFVYWLSTGCAGPNCCQLLPSI